MHNSLTINTDQHPYGMVMPNRSFSGTNYRYGFNGMEGDGEIHGIGNSYTTHFRQYDPRIGRWKSVDPYDMPWESPYIGMNNNPIVFNDVRGDCPWCGFFSAVIDAAIQVVDIATDPNKSWKEFSVTSVAASFVAGMAGAGIANNIKKLYSTVKLARRTKAAIAIATEITVDTGVEVARQKVVGEKVSVKKALISAVVDQTVGKFMRKTTSKVVKSNSKTIAKKQNQLSDTPKGPRGTKQRNRINRSIRETGEKIENGPIVQAAGETANGLVQKPAEMLEEQVESHVEAIPDGYWKETKSIGDGQSATWEGVFKDGKLYTGNVYIYDSDGLLKSISIVKNGNTVKRNGTFEDTEKMRNSNYGRG